MGARSIFLSTLLLACADARAQTVIQNNERLASDRPEAWAMNYFAATTFMTGFGETPALTPGQWQLGVELGHIPHLSEEQPRVGFNGFKSEDLNRSPALGRIRVMAGLPAGWVAELGYTPPVSINNTRPRNLVAAAIGRRVIERGRYALSARLLGQHGSVSGDITCPGELAGISDSERNPAGCQAASDDRAQLNYYGFELTSSLDHAPWRWHASLGLIRTELEVQVDALTFDVRDRSRLMTQDVVPYLAVGANRDLARHWHWGAEILYVPLTVQRNAESSRESDPLTSFRLQLSYRFD
jgi:hypothetical protein